MHFLISTNAFTHEKNVLYNMVNQCLPVFNLLSNQIKDVTLILSIITPILFL